MNTFIVGDKRVSYLLSVGQDSKSLKNMKYGYVSGMLYEAPSTYAEVGNACPDAQNCKDLCLGLYAGRAFNMKKKGAKHSTIVEARVKRSIMAKEDLVAYTARLKYEIKGIEAYADYLTTTEGKEYKTCVRLNGSTDKVVEKLYPTLFYHFDKTQFYDYTKSLGRMMRFLKGLLPTNYHLTFSRDNDKQFDEKCLKVLEMNGNVAVCFRNRAKLESYIENGYKGFTVIDGDKSDLTFLYDSGVIVGLTAKGKAKKDKSGFVVD
jgi:hypothetical protein